MLCRRRARHQQQQQQLKPAVGGPLQRTPTERCGQTWGGTSRSTYDIFVFNCAVRSQRSVPCASSSSTASAAAGLCLPSAVVHMQLCTLHLCCMQAMLQHRHRLADWGASSRVFHQPACVSPTGQLHRTTQHHPTVDLCHTPPQLCTLCCPAWAHIHTHQHLRHLQGTARRLPRPGPEAHRTQQCQHQHQRRTAAQLAGGRPGLAAGAVGP